MSLNTLRQEGPTPGPGTNKIDYARALMEARLPETEGKVELAALQEVLQERAFGPGDIARAINETLASIGSQHRVTAKQVSDYRRHLRNKKSLQGEEVR